MAIQDDYAVDWVNKRVHHFNGTTVYAVNALYTWLKQQEAQPQNSDDEEIMTAETPTAYTLKNGWFLDRGEGSYAHRYLTGGAIQSDDQTSNILKIVLDGTTDCIATDIGKDVSETSTIGPLLGYLNDYPVADAGVMWVRDTNTHGQVDDNDSVTIPTGTGAGTANGDSTTGDDLYGNPASLGSLASDPYAQLYVFQDGENISEWSALTNWDRGHMDVLILCKEMGQEIDDRYINVYARQGGDMHSHYRVQLSASGQDAVPLSTSTDLNADTGQYYLFYDGGNGTDFVAKDLIQADSGNWEAEVVSMVEWSSGVGVLQLRGYKELTAALADGNSFTVVGGSATGTTNGTLGDTYVEYDAEGGTPPVVSDTVEGSSTGARRILRGIQDDGTTGKLNLQVDGTQTGDNRDPHYRAFEDAENIEEDGVPANYFTASTDSTTIVSGFSDVTVAFVNGRVSHGGTTGTFTPGERVTYTGGEAIVIADTGSVLTLANVTSPVTDTYVITGDKSTAFCTASQDLQIEHTEDFSFSQQTAFPYSVFVQGGDIYEGGRVMKDIFEYIKFVLEENSAYNMYVMRDVLKHAYTYNNTGTAYADVTDEMRDDTAADVTLVDISDGEVNDAVYFGAAEEFGGIYINVTQAGAGSWTVVWEYWNGSWTALGNVDDDTGGFTAGGWNYVKWDWPTDWAITDVDATKGRYWVRARISVWTSGTTDAEAGQAFAMQYKDAQDGEEYIMAFPDFPQRVAAPIGSALGDYSGGTIYGAQGVWIEGMAAADSTSVSLTDSDGTVHDPYEAVTVKMTDIVAGTVVFIARHTAGLPEQYFTSAASGNNQGDSDFVVQEAIPIDTPDTGAVKIVDELGDDYRIRYTGWTAGTKTFAFVTKITGSTTGDGGRYTINDSGATFLSDDIEPGDVVRNTTDASWAHVVSVDDDNTITTTPLKGGTGDTWDNLDGYEFHTLPVTMDGNDLSYVGFLDDISVGTSLEKSVLFAATRSVMATARYAGRKPFSGTGQLTLAAGGYSVAAIIPVDAQYGL